MAWMFLPGPHTRGFHRGSTPGSEAHPGWTDVGKGVLACRDGGGWDLDLASILGM